MFPMIPRRYPPVIMEEKEKENLALLSTHAP
jgi:hypothetical protein